MSAAKTASSKQPFLPELIDLGNNNSNNEPYHHQKKIIASSKIVSANQNSPATNNHNKSKSLEAGQHHSSSRLLANTTATTINLDLLPRLTNLTNSALVHQRASASSRSSTVGDHLAVASVQTGASLPLMIGNRPKCVVNLLDEHQNHQSAHNHNHHNNHPSQNNAQNNSSQPSQQQQPVLGPQNTAMRAEQRRQNMSVSVVRPVVVVNGFSSTGQADCSPIGKLSSSSSSSSSSYSALIDDWMAFDRTYLNASSSSFGAGLKNGGCDASIDELLFSIKNSSDHQLARLQQYGTTTFDGSNLAGQLKLEQERQQTVAMVRREQHELNRNIGRQHQFIVDKLGERKRHLSIVQSVWFQRDFKHAIEKLVDIYHQGLIFTTPIESSTTTQHNSTNQQQQSCKLKSLHTSLVVDVISIIILRPKLWTLEICQLLLPIINQDLLMQSQYEYYTEIGLKALKLILAHFSTIIASTLESLKESNKLVGIDLSREDRINRCLVCYKLLLESHSVMSQLQQQSGSQKYKQAGGGVGLSQFHNNNDGQQCKLAALERELQAMFVSLFNSIQLNSSVLAKRFSG